MHVTRDVTRFSKTSLMLTAVAMSSLAITICEPRNTVDNAK